MIYSISDINRKKRFVQQITFSGETVTKRADDKVLDFSSSTGFVLNIYEC